MQNQFTHFLGIDVAKHHLEACLLSTQGCWQQRFCNDPTGISALQKWIRSLKIEKQQLLTCLEHTGVYALPLCTTLSRKGYFFCVVAALQIKQSSGVKRGKSDPLDAKAIAQYCRMKKDQLQRYAPMAKNILRLKFLLAHRSRLVQVRKTLQVAISEPEGFVQNDITRPITTQSTAVVKIVNQKIQQTEKLIRDIIQADAEMKRLYALLLTIPGIGAHIATQLLVCTGCFQRFESARKFACYSGVVPFEHRSGTSVKGRARVSHLANKKIKTLLNLAALAAKKTDHQIQQYYHRKLVEGKNPMLILNNIRNKLLDRIFATVKRGTPYVLTMNYS